MKKYITEYLEEMAETKSQATVKGHRSTLNRFANEVDADEPIEVTVKEVVSFRNNQYEEKKAGTVNTMLKRVKLFFSWCEQNKYLDISPASNIKLLTEGEKLPKWLDEKQEDLLIKVITKRYLGSTAKKKSYRELAIVMMMLKVGLRVGEVAGLKWDEVQFTGDTGKALIRGKQQQQRTVHLIPDVVKVLKQYKEFHGTKGEYVFYSQKTDSITERMIQKMLTEFKGAESKGIVLDELHPHILRHTFAHNLAKAGMGLESIARVLGHMKKNGEPNIQQTIRYTKASDDEIGEDMNKILGIS